ncbi:MAG: response regulator transcription factor [Chloroflexota bacterium]|nr:response regulator transcription factor [Chloroflexota bacterium]
MTRILFVDDHASFRQALALICSREPDMTVVGQAGSLQDARGMLDGVDVLVLDLDLPDGNGREIIGDLQAVNSNARVLVLTGSVNKLDLAQAVEAGADGVIRKLAGIEEIVTAIRRLSQGEHLLSPRDFMDSLRLTNQHRELHQDAQTKIGRLTAREREVLQSLAEGMSDKEIADQLHITADTARKHVVNILGKLGVDSRLQAVLFAVRNNAVELH